MFWNILRDLREQGKTIILTTHYMEEAQVLSDRVGIIYKGELVCCDTPRQLIHSLRAGTASLAARPASTAGRRPGNALVPGGANYLAGRVDRVQP